MNKLTPTVSLFVSSSAAAALLAATATTAAEPPRTLAPAERNAICDTRKTCKIEVHPAGRNGRGAPLAVAHARFGLADKPADSPDDGCRGEHKKDGGEEYWLLEDRQPPRRLLQLCNDGYGASGVGEDTVEVGLNQITHSQSGGSASRWSTTRVVQLSPLQLMEMQSLGYHVAMDNNSQSSGTLIETAPDLTIRHYIPTAANLHRGDNGLDLVDIYRQWQPQHGDTWAGMMIPLAQADAAIASATGYTLEGCHTRIAANGAPGYRVWGKADPQRKDDVRAVMLSPRVLVLQIHAPQPDDPARNWLGRDHVELWASSEPGESYLWEPGKPWPYNPNGLMQLAITLDGKTYPGVGKFPAPAVSRWTAQDRDKRPVTLLRLTFKQDIAANGLLLVWSQAEQGKQVRLAATAGISRNHPVMLPPIHKMSGTCKLAGQQLQRNLSGRNPFEDE